MRQGQGTADMQVMMRHSPDHSCGCAPCRGDCALGSVRKWSSSTQQVTLITDISGSGGCPVGLALKTNGDIVMTDQFSHVVRLIKPDLSITTIAGTGVPGFSGM